MARGERRRSSLVTNCMLCGMKIDREKDRGCHVLTIEVERMMQKSPFFEEKTRCREYATKPLYLCEKCGKTMVAWIDERRI